MHTPVYSFKKNIRKDDRNEKKLVPVKSFKSDALTIGPKMRTIDHTGQSPNGTKGIKKTRRNDRWRTVERIGGPLRTKAQNLRLLQTRLDEWYNRVIGSYNLVWKQFASMDLEDRNEAYVKEAFRMDFNPSLVQITLVLLLFEQKKWTFTHFKKNPPGQIPEWQIPLKLLMDNINTMDFGDESVYKRVPPERLGEALKRFIRTTMNKAKYQLSTGKVWNAIGMLAVIAYYEKNVDYHNFDDDADTVFAGFKKYLSDEVHTTIEYVLGKLYALKDKSMEWYEDEYSRAERGAELAFGFRNVWDIIKEVSEVDSPFERNDLRLWIFNDTEKFISTEEWETYHGIRPDQLEKMWDLFIDNVMDHAYQKLKELFSFDESLNDIAEEWI
jgi:hypothetical protein